MPDIRRNALMPKGEENGLAPIAGNLVDEGAGRSPRRLYAALVVIDCKRVAIDADSGEELATVRVRRIELLLPGDLPAAEKLLRRSLEHRSGATTLPLDMEDEIRDAFEAMTDADSPDDPDDKKGPKGGKS